MRTLRNAFGAPLRGTGFALNASRSALLGLGLLAAAAGHTAWAADDSAAARRSVTVTGTGEAAAAPDRARLSMSVEITKPQLLDAQNEANKIVRDYLAQAQALGAEDADISTASLSIRAEYVYSNAANGMQTRKFVGYHVSRGIEVVVRDLSRIGSFLSKATAAGVNNVSDPVLENSESAALQRQALSKAAADARARAETLAATLGVKLGPIRRLDSGGDAPPPGPRPLYAIRAKAEDSGGESDIGFSGGQIHYSATVSAEFDLLAP